MGLICGRRLREDGTRAVELGRVRIGEHEYLLTSGRLWAVGRYAAGGKSGDFGELLEVLVEES